MDIWEVISAICAVLTIIGTGFSWWRSNLSLDAQREANGAVARAEAEAKAAYAQAYEARRQVEATQKLVETLKAQVAAAEAAATEAKRQADHSASQAKDVKKISETLRGPDFEVQHVNKMKFALTNKTSGSATIECVHNLEDFLRLEGLPDGLVLAPYETLQFLAGGAAGKPLPPNLVLKIAGREDLVRLALIRDY